MKTIKFQENRLVDKFATRLKEELCAKLDTRNDYEIVLDKVDELLFRDVNIAEDEQ